MIERNRVLATRWFDEVWNKRMSSTVDELIDQNAVGHMEGSDTHGPDLTLTVEDIVCQGENVVIRWSASGTHKGAHLGMAPTNRSVAFRGMTWQTFKNGAIVEGWDSWNQGAVFQSLQATS
jgi:predicted ester cyclase